MLFILLFHFYKSNPKWQFLSRPAIHTINFKKILETTIPTEKGHIEQGCSNLQTTKQNEQHLDYFPAQENKTKKCIFKMIDIQEPKKTQITWISVGASPTHRLGERTTYWSYMTMIQT